MLKTRTYFCGALVYCLMSITSVQAQSSSGSPARVDAKTDWSVFVAESPKECWVVSKPSKVVNTRGGKVVSANRGDILLFVSYRPAAGVKGEISFTGGYPFKSNTPVKLAIGSSSYSLYVDGEWAWPATSAEDAKIAASMRRGAVATLTGQSSRGTTTKDTFSLSGFTAAVVEAAKRCS